METENLYTPQQVEEIAMIAAKCAVQQFSKPPNLDNGTEASPEGDDTMSKRIKQQVEINGTTHWLSGSCVQDLLDSYLALCVKSGVVVPQTLATAQQESNTPLFGPYLTNFNEVYKSKQQSLTRRSRDGVAKKHLIPKWGSCPLDTIKTSDIQLWFNELESQGYSHETLLKLKNTMSPALDAAVEDGYITRNPMRSQRLRIGGAPTEHHKAIPSEKMEAIRSQISLIQDPRVRRMAALLCNTGMRLEEVLGLKWEDIDMQDNWISIVRAVVHPTRNLPEVKCPKSVSSKRRIPLTNALKEQLGQKFPDGFVVNSDGDASRQCPLSFTEARRCINKIRDMFDLKGYSAHDFRDTCATEWREAGIPTDIIARLLGHAKSDITETRYVKYREDLFDGVRNVMEAKNGTQNGTDSQTPQPL